MRSSSTAVCVRRIHGCPMHARTHRSEERKKKLHADQSQRRPTGRGGQRRSAAGTTGGTVWLRPCVPGRLLAPLGSPPPCPHLLLRMCCIMRRLVFQQQRGWLPSLVNRESNSIRNAPKKAFEPAKSESAESSKTSNNSELFLPTGLDRRSTVESARAPGAWAARLPGCTGTSLARHLCSSALHLNRQARAGRRGMPMRRRLLTDKRGADDLNSSATDRCTVMMWG